MAVITLAERGELRERLKHAASTMLALVWNEATGEDPAWALNNPPSVVAVKLIGLLSDNPAMAVTVCTALLRMIPNHPGNVALTAIVARLNAQQAQAAADPTQEIWIRSEPMVNRAALRSLLREIVDGFHHGVIYVAGGPMSGRSHSFQLIRHVGRSMDINPRKIDFRLASEARTVQHLYRGLREALGIDVDREPTHEGATPGDVAGKFAAQLRTLLTAAPLADPKPWLVIDFSDEVPDPAVPEFIRLLCADRDANEFDNCVIFVLGPTAHLDSMRGELLNMRVEDIGPVALTEILDAAKVVNQRAGHRLDDFALRERATAIYRDAMQLPEDAQMPAVRQALVELRQEVNAP